MMNDLRERLIADIDAQGPMAFEQFVERALYDPSYGFYAVHGKAGGRRGDFITSVEAGPLFAGVVADWLDTMWREAGEPATFRVTEAGAGVGTLFRGINRAQPACFDVLSYTLVERSASMRVAHQSLPTQTWRSSATLPDEHQHVVLANELLDNLAFGLAERRDDGWAPVRVDVDIDELVLRVGDPHVDLNHLGALAPDAVVGTRVPVGAQAAAWIEQATAASDHVLIFDYAATTAELAARDQGGWLRTYVDHVRGSNPLTQIGLRDITHDVPIDQLPAADSVQTQGEWLRSHGIADRVETARELWAERGHVGDLQAIAARSAIGEAEALTDPAGLGGFLAMEWHQ